MAAFQSTERIASRTAWLFAAGPRQNRNGQKTNRKCRLRNRQVELHGRRSIQRIVMNVTDDADDRARRDAGSADMDVLAERILAGQIFAGGGFVHQHHLLGILGVIGLKNRGHATVGRPSASR